MRINVDDPEPTVCPWQETSSSLSGVRRGLNLDNSRIFTI